MKHKFLLSMFLIFIAISIGIIVSFGWYEIKTQQTYSLSPGEFEANITLYLNNQEVTSSNPYYDSETQTIELNAFDTTAENYIDNLKVSIDINAHNTSRFRIKIMDQWTLVRTYTNDTVKEVIIMSEERDENSGFQSRYHYSNEFFRIKEDTYFYYDGLLHPNEPVMLDFIDGADQYPKKVTESYTETVYVTFTLHIDCVQANRVEELWEVDAAIFD